MRATVRATTTQRDYGHNHQQERARWAAAVNRGEAYCHAETCLMTTRWIQPGTPWDLGHNRDRTAWTGPEHARCNRSDGARRGNTTRNQHTPLQPRQPTGW